MPQVVHPGAWIAAEQMVDAGIEEVPLAFPDRALAAGLAVHFKDSRLEAVYPIVDPRGQAAHARAYDNYRLACHCLPRRLKQKSTLFSDNYIIMQTVNLYFPNALYQRNTEKRKNRDIHADIEPDAEIC